MPQAVADQCNTNRHTKQHLSGLMPMTQKQIRPEFAVIEMLLMKSDMLQKAQ